MRPVRTGSAYFDYGAAGRGSAIDLSASGFAAGGAGVFGAQNRMDRACSAANRCSDTGRAVVAACRGEGAYRGVAACCEIRPSGASRTAFAANGVEICRCDDSRSADEVGMLYGPEYHFIEPVSDGSARTSARFRAFARIVSYGSSRPFGPIPCFARPIDRRTGETARSGVARLFDSRIKCAEFIGF